MVLTKSDFLSHLFSMETLLDALLNSWEHWEDLQEESLLLSQEIGGTQAEIQDLQPHILRLLKAWVDNEDNVRLNIQMHYHQSPAKYNLEILKFIKQFVQV